MSTEKLTIEELLFTDEPIVVNRKLAKCLGLKEAVIFQQIHYWIKANKKAERNFKEGRYWTFNSIKKWQEKEFDFLSVRTVERTLQKLEKDELLITKTFNKMAGDKTKWYTINYEKLLEVCEKHLGEKEVLSIKRKQAGAKGALAKASKNATSANDEVNNTHTTNLAECTPCNQLGNTIQPTWQHHTTNLAEPIPKTTTKTSTNTTCSSSSEEKTSQEKLVELFESTINKLGKTTKPKFLKFVQEYDEEFIEALIAYCEEAGAKSYRWFESTINSYIEKNITTKEALLKSIAEFRAKSKKAQENKEKRVDRASKGSNRNYSSNYHQKEVQGLGFNNFEARSYDYDSLEKKLLGWDKDETPNEYQEEPSSIDLEALGVGSAL